MSCKKTLSIIFTVVALGTLVLQPVKSPAQAPTVAVDSYYLLRADKILTVIPSTAAEMQGKGKLGGFAGVKSIVRILGESAAIRIPTGGRQAFVLGVQGPMSDTLPSLLHAMLHKLDVKRGAREWVAGEVKSYFVTGKARGFDPRGIPLEFSRYDAQAIKIQPRSPLPPGEYAFVSLDVDPYRPANQSRLHCSGVDR